MEIISANVAKENVKAYNKVSGFEEAICIINDEILKESQQGISSVYIKIDRFGNFDDYSNELIELLIKAGYAVNVVDSQQFIGGNSEEELYIRWYS